MILIGFGNKARQGKDSAAEAIKKYYSRNNDIARLFSGPGFGIRVGIFKYATALYQEVNEWLNTSEGKRFRGLGGSLLYNHYVVDPGEGYNDCRNGLYLGKAEWTRRPVILPDWVQPDSNSEVTELAPYGKHPKLLQWWGTEFRRSQDPEYWVKKLTASIPANLDIAMVTDVRFPNEADAIRQQGGSLVNVQRLRRDGTQYFADDRPVNHPSETALDDYNWDYFLKVKDGDQELLAQQAITLAEYLRGKQ